MGKFHVGRKDDNSDSTMIEPVSTVVMEFNPIQDSFQMTEKIIYVDRPVEITKEVIVQVEKIVYVDKIIEVEVPGKTLVEHKTVEVPVMYEKIVEVPVYIEKEVIKEVTSKVVDITEHLEIKRKIRANKRLQACLALSVILNVILMAVL